MTGEFPAEVIAELFPRVALYAFPPAGFAFDRDRDRVTEGEIRILLDAASKKRSAPGPNGVHYRILGRSVEVMCSRLSSLYTACFEEASFPKQWKLANLVLLEKPGRDPSKPGAYRPICLLDVEGKLFERVVASRIIGHMGADGGRNDLSPNQYGFRLCRSTIDALVRMPGSTSSRTSFGGVAIAVSIDIKNAFNTVPWCAIKDGLTSKSVPDCLVSVIGSFLSERKIAYEKPDGTTGRADVFCGVPQGSVLGPVLWNVAYDRVLNRTVLPDGVSLTCYVDDTLLLATGRGWAEVRERAEAGRWRPSGTPVSGCLCRRRKLAGFIVRETRVLATYR
ncbi:endonuclease/reverse transcriptase, putative [Pediculus humanus corporis]|uniref:Endonuclease/reverse transcriptase, putative n=1 Tax=Pediculus humanus subsp. corporis TaxID=121224 RepID=E0VRT2_PEDHC|nr:endonuclease/reverse transcriptase, putative [Pediculus humanus corporis]EEB16088.1 endonuclease/reverse transcriptase, putative [Pediculus humanus corporis]